MRKEDLFIVSSDIPDKNLFILKNIYPNAKIIKEVENKGEKEDNMELFNLLGEIGDYCSKNIKEFLDYHYEFKENKILSNKINGNENFVIKIMYEGKESFGSNVKYLVIGCDILNKTIYKDEFYISEDDYDSYFEGGE